ncbi:DNA-binding protein with MIZ/SP-RING zinc finger [Striga asiatica]|uniref:DNA-binding protein with MIZ/SP-RING zinc finger n=1 Tax=Striga asiatica TaxID=4170 RepID=A0A5A7RKM1_STRAF|nr:DNA-binding protein with MIZ/SP-RING zinc finger [Striga asiatica]
MDLVASCKFTVVLVMSDMVIVSMIDRLLDVMCAAFYFDLQDKLAYFRIKELKDVLTQLGLSKQGKKQDLVDRILAVLSDEQVSGMWAKKNAVGKEGVAKLVDDTYRKMQVSGAADLASKSQAISDSPSIKHKEEAEDSYQMEKIRCVCGSTLATDSMIKCEDPRCNVWQHMACVLIPEKPVEGVLPNPPDIFYCEICRLSRADPFLVTVAHPLNPVKLNITNVPADGSSPSQSIEKTFQLTRADRDLLSKQEFDVQAWCMLLNDKVMFRMQWPQYADLQINGVPVRAINRPGSQLLGANGRDDGPVITPCTRDGINKIFLGGCDARVFCVGVRIVKRRTLKQVLNIIPKESEGELFEDALARVRRCVGGGAPTENADSDSDIEVVADFIPVNLRCPMSGLRMKVAGRFKPCAHMGCFDLEVFVEMNQRSRKASPLFPHPFSFSPLIFTFGWQCPICLKNYSLEKIIIDPYFNRITSKLQKCGEDVAEIEVKPDGSWRAKAEGGDRRALGELGLWHSPDGSICASMEAESKPKPELKPVKQEVGSDSNPGLRLGMRKNQNGRWVISPANKTHENFQNSPNVIPMSSSATGSGRECEDASVNQDGGPTTLDFSTVNGVEYESISMINAAEANGFVPAGDAAGDIIVLSDSDEEEIEPQTSSGAAVVYKNSSGPDVGGPQFPSVVQNQIPDPYYENPALGNMGNSCLGLFNVNEDDFGMNTWSLPSGNQGGAAGFQLFGSDVDVSDALVDMQQHQGPLNCSSSSMNGYTMTAETAAMGSAALVPESTSGPGQRSNVNDGLIDNPLAFGGNDPSLQIFLPTRPSGMQLNLRDADVPNSGAGGVGTEDWISLRLGDGVGGRQGETGPGARVGSGQQVQSGDGGLGTLADGASLLLGMNGNRSGKATREGSDSPFNFPRQRRSVRPRLYLSIDSESE